MAAPIKILFLAANPLLTSKLRLDEEIRGIDQAIRQAEFRERFDIKQQWAVRVRDLQSHLLRHQPNIVHFSGHGSTASEIILEDRYGNCQSVPNSALGRLFSVFKKSIRCVILNACFSEKQANAIAEHIDCVIGMTRAVEDETAINFAIAFYQALGYGKDVKTAFELGCIEIGLENLNGEDVPKLIALTKNPKRITFGAKNKSPQIENRKYSKPRHLSLVDDNSKAKLEGSKANHLIGRAFSELLQINPNLDDVEAMFARLESTGVPPSAELIKAKKIYDSVKLHQTIKDRGTKMPTKPKITRDRDWPKPLDSRKSTSKSHSGRNTSPKTPAKALVKRRVNAKRNR